MLYESLLALLETYGIDEHQWQTVLSSIEIVEKISTDDKQFWLKKAEPARGVVRYYVLNMFGFILGKPLLRAVPQPGGKEAIQIEISRLKKLANNNVLVPKVIASSEKWLLVEDLGPSINSIFKDKNTSVEKRNILFSACLSAIHDLHQKKQYLSQAFSRNMLLAEDNPPLIAFIDFEDDPLEVMNLNNAQARDILLFIYSTAGYFTNDHKYFLEAIQLFLKIQKPEVLDAIKKNLLNV